MPKVTESSLEQAEGFSFFELFLNASLVVQLVIVLLILMSMLSWAVMLDRSFHYFRVKRKIKTFDKKFWSGLSLDDLFDVAHEEKNSPLAAVFVAAIVEWRRSHSSEKPAFFSIRQRIDRVMDTSITKEVSSLEKYLSILATTGSAAPFIGLFGTVWGIMTSFQAIAITKSTNIAVVAPHIAEALLATAIGLFAAIPAVMAYNRLIGQVNAISEKIEAFSDEFSTLLSRQVDERI